MEDRKLHIIVAGEEGRVKRFSLSVSFLKKAVGAGVVLVCLLFVMSLLSLKLLLSERSRSHLVARLSAEVESLRQENFELKKEVLALRKENKRILKDAVAELKKRSSAIEKILSEIGFGSGSSSGKGGPFVPAPSAESYEELLKKTEYLLENIKYIPLGYPVYGRITSKFGMRIDPFNGRWAFHSGVDIKGRVGTPVRATACGVVEKVGYNRGYGRFVVVRHGNGFSTLYAHLCRIKVRKGERVERGEVIGLMGNTGRSTGPHLHYEVRVGNKPVNPLKFMKVKEILRKG